MLEVIFHTVLPLIPNSSHIFRLVVAPSLIIPYINAPLFSNSSMAFSMSWAITFLKYTSLIFTTFNYLKPLHLPFTEPWEAKTAIGCE